MRICRLFTCAIVSAALFSPGQSFAQLPIVRIAHGAFSEKIAALWVGAEQDLYSLDIKPTNNGIQNMARFLALSNPKVKSVKIEDVLDEAPWQRLERSVVYRELTAAAKK